MTHVWREPVETRDATAAAAVSTIASVVRHEGSATTIAQVEANAVEAQLAISPSLPVDESVPVFDIARVERTGDAVIAGRAAPGAIVELLRMASAMIERSQIHLGNSSWFLPAFPPGTMS
jgi:hypothetical protein